MQRTGTEWLHRLLSEPRRLVGRYTRTNARFAGMLLRERMRKDR
jgi:N-acetylglucosaminyldiphosphoundecaprenol N-acetyl-beta-D-mannosaminyltransferase